MSDDTLFGPSSKKTYAALNPTDLETLGKIACSKYLNGEMSLNDAVVKLAREYPSISNHQIRRVVEFANQETFARLFEKQAGDKNVDFTVADPGHVLQALNDSARPGSVNVIPAEYSQDPVKHAHSAADADLAIAKMFGLDLMSPRMEKVADEATDKIQAAYENSALPDQGAVLSSEQYPMGARQMSSDEEAMKLSGPLEDRFAAMSQQQPQAPQGQIPPGQMAAGPVEQPDAQTEEQMPAQELPGTDQQGNTHQARMLELQREIEYAKKREELAKIQQKMMAAMNPAAAQAQEAAQPAQAQAQDPNAQAQDPVQMMAAQQQAQQAQQPQQPQEPEIPAPLSGAIATPPGSMPTKMGSVLVKQAMTYVKVGRPGAFAVLGDLEKAASLENIKSKLARQDYPEANPFGDLLRLREKVAHLYEEATVASEANKNLLKEAMDNFVYEVNQHVLRDGSLGEVAHALECTPGEGYLKEAAMKLAMKDLVHRGLNVDQAQAEVVKYEVEKQGQVRVSNKDNPIVDAFLSLQKVASVQDILSEAANELGEYRQQIELTFRKVVGHASSR